MESESPTEPTFYTGPERLLATVCDGMSVSSRALRLIGSALLVTTGWSLELDDERLRPGILGVEGAEAGPYSVTMTSWQPTDDAALPPGDVP
jgi:hypothetical protein